jgi:hypothetical protein
METEIAGATAEYQKLLNEDLPDFNRFLAANSVASLVATINMKSDQRDGN